jgi:hypothetical protein
MMLRGIPSAIVLAALLLGGAAPAGFWRTGRTEAGAPFAIAMDEGDASPMMRFECAPDALVATLYGATHLIDPATDREIGDAPGSEMTGDAAQMALITDTVNAHWDWAVAKPNREQGWDLTIRLPFDHEGFRALPRAKMIGLATTGGASAAAVEKTDRQRLAEFVRQCRGGGRPAGR